MAKLPTSTTLLLVLALTTTTLGQGFGGYGGNGNPFSNGDGGGNDNGGRPGNPYSNGGSGQDFSFAGLRGDFSRYTVLVTAHAVLATLAFGLLLPLGGILIRLASFRGLWLAHAGLQVFASLLYIAAAGLGIWMTTQSPRHNLLSAAHPIIGLTLLVLLLLFQPALGIAHHLGFRKSARRGLAGHAHVWIGRVVITLGIVNGGLGLWWAQRSPVAPPSTGAVVGYGVGAGVMWVLYVAAVIVGERRRSGGGKARKSVAEGDVTPSEEGDERHVHGNKELYA